MRVVSTLKQGFCTNSLPGSERRQVGFDVAGTVASRFRVRQPVLHSVGLEHARTPHLARVEFCEYKLQFGVFGTHSTNHKRDHCVVDQRRRSGTSYDWISC